MEFKPFLTKEMAVLAVELARPGIEKLLTVALQGELLLNKPVIAISIVSVKTNAGGVDVAFSTRFDIGHHEHIIMDDGRWNDKYDRFALAKARLAAREKMDTSVIVNDHPSLLQPGDIKFPGGVYSDGIAVGASGVQGYFDEMIARMVLAICLGLCKHGAAELQKAESPWVK